MSRETSDKGDEMNVLSSAIGGRLRKRTSGVDRSQAACKIWGSDPVKEIGQTCGLNVIMRRTATSDTVAVHCGILFRSCFMFLLQEHACTDAFALTLAVDQLLAGTPATVSPSPHRDNALATEDRAKRSARRCRTRAGTTRRRCEAHPNLGCPPDSVS